jgi:hypothetical protein
MTPEGRVKEAAKRLLKKLGIWFFMPVQTGRGVGGVPDFVCCVPVVVTQDMVGQTIGVFVAPEAKAPGKRGNLSDLQQRQIAAIHKAGGVAFAFDNAEQLKSVPFIRARMEVLDADPS